MRNILTEKSSLDTVGEKVKNEIHIEKKVFNMKRQSQSCETKQTWRVDGFFSSMKGSNKQHRLKAEGWWWSRLNKALLSLPGSHE